MPRKPNYAFERNARAKAKADKREAKRQAKQAAKVDKQVDDDGVPIEDGVETEAESEDKEATD